MDEFTLNINISLRLNSAVEQSILDDAAKSSIESFLNERRLFLWECADLLGQEIRIESENKEQGLRREKIIAKAKERYGSGGEVEFDGDARLSESDEGYYVQGWCYVSDNEE